MDSTVVSLIENLYSKDDCIREIFAAYRNRERDPRNGRTILKNIRHDLGGRFSIERLRTTFLDLENCNCGKFHNGRPIKNGYFKWSESPREIAAELAEPPATTNGNEVLSKGDSNNPIEIFPFPVRPGITLPVAIRRDMIASELMNLSDFVKVIAASRPNALTSP